MKYVLFALSLAGAAFVGSAGTVVPADPVPVLSEETSIDTKLSGWCSSPWPGILLDTKLSDWSYSPWPGIRLYTGRLGLSIIIR